LLLFRHFSKGNRSKGFTVHDAIRKGANSLSSHGISNPYLEAQVLLAFSMGVRDRKREYILANTNNYLNFDQMDFFFKLISRRVTQEPLSYITKTKEFYSREFKVSSQVLIPRPSSETIIDTAISLQDIDRPLRILELGVGSGCLLLSLLHHFRNAHGVGVDISKDALSVASDNALELKVSDRVHLYTSNWFSDIPRDAQFDLIVSNPPYIPLHEASILDRTVIDFEPHVALFGGDDGFQAYRDIAKGLIDNHHSFLASDGHLLLEIGHKQRRDVQMIFESNGLKFKNVIKDLEDIERCVVFQSIK